MSKEEILASFGFESPSKTSGGASSHQPTQPADEWPTVQIDWDALHDQQTHKQQHDQSMDHSDSESSDDDQPISQAGNQSINAMNQWKRDLHDDEWVDPNDAKPINNESNDRPITESKQPEWNPSISQFSSLSWDNAQTFEHSIDSHDEGGLTEQSMSQSIDNLINQPIDDMTDQQKQALQVKIDASIKQTIHPTAPRQRAAPDNEPTSLPVNQSQNQPVDPSITNDEITPSDHLIEPPNQNALIDPDQYESMNQSNRPSNQTDDPLAHLPASIRAMLIEGRDKVNEQYRTKPT